MTPFHLTTTLCCPSNKPEKGKKRVSKVIWTTSSLTDGETEDREWEHHTQVRALVRSRKGTCTGSLKAQLNPSFMGHADDGPWEGRETEEPTPPTPGREDFLGQRPCQACVCL